MHYCLFVKVLTILFRIERRRRDLNPRAAINDLHPFQGCPFGLLGTSPSGLNHQPHVFDYRIRPGRFQRRGWDSNPRALADKRFSRPPRYDHFDTSPGVFAKEKQRFIFRKRSILFCFPSGRIPVSGTAVTLPLEASVLFELCVPQQCKSYYSEKGILCQHIFS